MKSINKKAFTGILAAFAFAVVSALNPVVPVSAQTPEAVDDCKTMTINGGIECAKPAGAADNLFGSSSIFTNIVNTLLFVIGAISVIMLIYGGIRYTLSAGNAAQVTSAKNTIMYAIVGLIVAFLAFALVNWVLGSLMPAATDEETTGVILRSIGL